MNEMTQKEKIIDKLANFVQNNRTSIGIVFGIVVIGIIVFFAWNQITINANKAALKELKILQEIYQEWYSESDEDSKQSKETDIMDKIASIEKQFAGTFATKKAMQMKANIYFSKKEYETAAKHYLDISQKFPQSELARISLFNSAVCNEELEKYDDAKKLYNDIIDNYSKSAETPKAVYAIARILIKQGENEEAKEFFSTMEEKYAHSDWQIIVQNLKIDLKAKGLIQ